MECFEKGMLTEKDTNGIRLTFGNVEGMLKVMEMICKREGIGDLLAEGTKRTAQKIGQGAEKYAMQVKGSELPMQHYPYLTPIVVLGYGLSPTGADHIRNIKVGGYRFHMPGPMLEAAAPFGLLEPLPPRSEHLRSPAWVRTYMYITNWYTAWDCIRLCNFLGNGHEVHQVAEIVRGITGWNAADFELMEVGEGQ